MVNILNDYVETALCWTITTVTWQPRGIEARVAVLGGQEQISKIHNKMLIKYINWRVGLT